MNQFSKTLIKAILFLSFGLVVLYFLYQHQNQAYIEECLKEGVTQGECSLLDKVITDFKSVKIVWIIVVILFFMLSNLLRALRWNQMLEPMGYFPRLLNSMAAIMIAYFSNLGLPRSGEVLRPATLSKYENIPFDKLMGTIILERAIDVLFLLISMGLVLILAGDTMLTFFQENATIKENLWFLFEPMFWLGCVALGLIGLYILFVSPVKNSKFVLKLKSFLMGIKEGVLSIAKLKNPILFYLYSIGIWVLYFLMTYVCFFAFFPTSHLGPVAGLVVFVFGTLGIVFPSPGGMGSYHWLVTESLGFYNIGAADGFSFANIIFFSIQIFCNVFFGIISLILLPIINRNKINEPDSE